MATAVDLLQPWPIKWLVDYVFGTQTPPGWLASLWPAIGARETAGGIAAVCFSILWLGNGNGRNTARAGGSEREPAAPRP